MHSYSGSARVHRRAHGEALPPHDGERIPILQRKCSAVRGNGRHIQVATQVERPDPELVGQVEWRLRAYFSGEHGAALQAVTSIDCDLNGNVSCAP